MRSCFSLAIPSSLRFFQKRPSCGSPCSRGNRSLATAVSASYPPSRSYSDFFLMTCLLELSGERSFLFDALGLIQLQGALRRVEDDDHIFPGIGHDCAEAYLNLEWSREHLAAGRREPRESLGDGLDSEVRFHLPVIGVENQLRGGGREPQPRRLGTAPDDLVPEILGIEGERRIEVRYGDAEAVDLPEEWGRHAAEDSAIPCWAQGGADVLA